MNIMHMKYAVEIAKAGSINKASDILLIAQPNLSRSVKELEADLGITIFDRSSKGMFLTPEGEEFIGYAKKILEQIDEVEAMYKTGLPEKQKFSISVPRSSYISDAFANFSILLSDKPAEIVYNETNSLNTINNILQSDYNLGIIRYSKSYDKYFKKFLDEKSLSYELISEFTPLLIVSADSELAKKPELKLSDLNSFIEIVHDDQFVPALPVSAVKREELSDNISRRIFVFERASQFDLLSKNNKTFMWGSALPDKLLKEYSFVQRSCAEYQKLYKDVLIYRKDYRLSELDKKFITELCNSKRRYL